MIVDPDFCDHWKTRLLVNAIEDEAAPVYLLRLWSHCQNRRQWVFDSMSAEALKALCRFPGHSNKLEAALVTSGFIRRDGMHLVVCNWDEYNSSLIAAWDNGKRGGRPPNKNPKETRGLPVGNQQDTHGKPSGNPRATHGKPIREDKRRIDKTLDPGSIENINTTAAPKELDPAPDVNSGLVVMNGDLGNLPDRPADWAAAAAALKEFGVQRIQSCLSEAKKAGFKPSDVLGWIGWLTDPACPQRRSQVGPGAILDRIRTPEARSWAPGHGWPSNVTPTVTGHVTQTASPSQLKLTASEEAQLVTLNHQFGAVLDAMSDQELKDLIGKQRSPVNLDHWRTAPVYRLDLLMKLKRQREARANG